MADDQDLLPHSHHSEFTHKKARHSTGIRNSPRRGDGAPPPVHPYEPDQPVAPHWSQETFDTKKRVHATEIRCSPRRAQSSAIASPDLVPGGPDTGKDRHTSQRQFSIEKGEHLTTVLPVREPAPSAGPRDPQGYRHKSCDALAKEKMGHKTPLYPEMPTGSKVRGSGVIDNFLNLRPHEDGFLHSSHETFSREKLGHLTAIHCSPKRSRGEEAAAPAAPPQPEPGSSADFPHKSAEEFGWKKARHSTGIHSSPPRRNSGERDAAAVQARSRSPPGCYQSQSSFKQAKIKHATPINPTGPSARRSQDGASAAGDTSIARKGYASYTHFSTDKKRHVANVDERRLRSEATASAAVSPQPRSGHGSVCRHPPGDVHKSHTEFTEDKMRHLTDIRASPPRGGRASAGQSGSSRNYTSLKELQRAKRGHQTVLGAGSPGGVTSPPTGPHTSYRAFSHEKRGHATGILNSPPMREPAPAGSVQRSPGYDGAQHQSHRQFSADKSKHRTDINPSPPRGAHSAASSSVRRGPPEAMTSHHQFSIEKSKHSYEMDSPRRGRAAPIAPPSPVVPPSGDRTPVSQRQAPSEHRSSRASTGGY
eukprot:TRINITY_DN6226_c0_g1_i1.p1 TRINITY_DN6226_c0_g1~~TRINITY_DN6226_c0_g1_i1.p1  ORF type:complete len:613 (+),score=131.71 TRINITY_DN6226_c0_g1_i1:66-1841(+)